MTIGAAYIEKLAENDRTLLGSLGVGGATGAGLGAAGAAGKGMYDVGKEGVRLGRLALDLAELDPNKINSMKDIFRTGRVGVKALREGIELGIPERLAKGQSANEAIIRSLLNRAKEKFVGGFRPNLGRFTGIGAGIGAGAGALSYGDSLLRKAVNKEAHLKTAWMGTADGSYTFQ